MIDLINDDCFKKLNEMEDHSVDLIILDPDYNLWADYLKRGLIDSAIRKLKFSGNIICFTKQPFDQELRNTIQPIFRREIIWTFENGGAWVSNRMPLVSFQKIYWCVISKDFFFNPRTGLSYNEKTKDFKRTTKTFLDSVQEGRQFEKSDEGIWMRDHFHYNKPLMGKIPAKPIELLQVLIRCLSKEGDLVLDPFMGSGNVGIACAMESRNYIGIEQNKETFELACSRISKVTN